MRGFRTQWAVGVLALAGAASGAGAAPAFGVLGDSLGAEYQFSDGTRPLARNYVELLAVNRGLNFGAFTTASRGQPRNEGYEYNWANAGELTPNGVTGSDLFALGQVQGLAQQVALGQVDHVFVTIGGNDLRLVAGGADANAVLTNLFTSTVGAIQTLKAANPNVKVVVANVVDITKVPAAQFALAANPGLAGGFAALDFATSQYNANLAAFLAADPNVAIADINAVLDTLLATGQVGGVPIDTLNPGAGPDHLFIDELHPGTIGQGLIANAFASASNARFGTTIALLGADELRAIAAAPAAGVPLPAAVWAGAVCAPLVWRRARRMAA